MPSSLSTLSDLDLDFDLDNPHIVSISNTTLPAQTTHELLTTLEQLRDTLSARVDQLGVSVERLRVQAGELERSLSTNLGEQSTEDSSIIEGTLLLRDDVNSNTYINTNIMSNPAENESPDVRLVNRVITSPTRSPYDPPGGSRRAPQRQAPPSPRSTARPPTVPLTASSTSTSTGTSRVSSRTASSSITLEMQGLPRPITESEIGELLDRASQQHIVIQPSLIQPSTMTRIRNLGSTAAAAPPITPLTLTSIPTHAEMVRYLEPIISRIHTLAARVRGTADSAEIDRWTTAILQDTRAFRRARAAFRRAPPPLGLTGAELRQERSEIESLYQLGVVGLRRAMHRARDSGWFVDQVEDIEGMVSQALREGNGSADSQAGPLPEARNSEAKATEQTRVEVNVEPRQKGLPPTNSYWIRNRPEPIIVRSDPVSPVSTVKADDVDDVQLPTAPEVPVAPNEPPARTRAARARAARSSLSLTTPTSTDSAAPLASQPSMQVNEPNFGSVVANLLAAARAQPRADNDSPLTTRGRVIENRIARSSSLPTAPPTVTNSGRRLASILVANAGNRSNTGVTATTTNPAPSTTTATATSPTQPRITDMQGYDPTDPLARAAIAARATDMRAFAREIAGAYGLAYHRAGGRPGMAVYAQVIIEVGVPDPANDNNNDSDMVFDLTSAPPNTRLRLSNIALGPSVADRRNNANANRRALSPLRLGAIGSQEAFDRALDETLDIARQRRNLPHVIHLDLSNGPTPSSPTIARERSAEDDDIEIDQENGVIIFRPGPNHAVYALPQPGGGNRITERIVDRNRHRPTGADNSISDRGVAASPPIVATRTTIGTDADTGSIRRTATATGIPADRVRNRARDRANQPITNESTTARLRQDMTHARHAAPWVRTETTSVSDIAEDWIERHGEYVRQRYPRPQRSSDNPATIGTRTTNLFTDRNTNTTIRGSTPAPRVVTSTVSTGEELTAILDASAERLRRTRERIRDGQGLMRQIGDLRADLNLVSATGHQGSAETDQEGIGAGVNVEHILNSYARAGNNDARSRSDAQAQPEPRPQLGSSESPLLASMDIRPAANLTASILRSLTQSSVEGSEVNTENDPDAGVDIEIDDVHEDIPQNAATATATATAPEPELNSEPQAMAEPASRGFVDMALHALRSINAEAIRMEESLIDALNASFGDANEADEMALEAVGEGVNDTSAGAGSRARSGHGSEAARIARRTDRAAERQRERAARRQSTRTSGPVQAGAPRASAVAGPSAASTASSGRQQATSSPGSRAGAGVEASAGAAVGREAVIEDNDETGGHEGVRAPAMKEDEVFGIELGWPIAGRV